MSRVSLLSIQSVIQAINENYITFKIISSLRPFRINCFNYKIERAHFTEEEISKDFTELAQL